MSKYNSLYLDIQGKPVDANDDTRLMWYSAKCSYWTDDWSKLGYGIPSCPNCHSVGLHSLYKEWERSAKRYDNEVKEGYWIFLQEYKEKCAKSTKEAFALWLDTNGKKLLEQSLKDAVSQLSSDLVG